MSALHNIFKHSDFRRLFAGVTTSHLGDQFALIATPWLVMQLTGDPLALGLVLALGGAPRAQFMLLGGAVTDRYSPRAVLLACDLARLVLAGLMALVVLTGAVEMWMVYAFALGFGLIAGFAIPAGNSMVPVLLGTEDLEAGNAMIMGGGQLMGFFGPFVAGVLVGAHSQTLTGVGLCFGIDALTFAFSAIMLLTMRQARALTPADRGEGEDSVWQSVTQGLRYVWVQEEIRLSFLIIAAVNFLFVGPLMVGVPVLADQRLPEGAVAFGLLMSGFAGGNLAGYALAGALPKPAPETLRHGLVALLACFAVVLAVLGLFASTWTDFALLAALGIGNGYATIVLISALQARVAKNMLGRLMGLFMFAGLGLVPISEAIAGALGRWDVSLLFTSAAVLMAGVAIWSATQPGLLAISAGMARRET